MALPKYPQLKKEVSKLLIDYFNEQAQKELGPLQGIRSFVQHEGKNLVHNTMDNVGEEQALDYVTASTDYSMKYEDIPKMGMKDVLAQLDSMAKDFGAQQARHHYQVISKTTEKTGNVVEAGGKPFSVDTYLELLGKVQIDFDEHGQPIFPSLVVPPKNYEKVSKVVEDVATNPNHREKLENIIKEKKEQYDAEQASRKLVD